MSALRDILTGTADDCDALVLGSGIIGVSTAIVLQSLGLKVLLLADAVEAQAPDTVARPLVPTNYAMASAYPHNLKIENLQEISEHSQTVLTHLSQEDKSGIHKYKLFEVFEHKPDEAALGNLRMNFQTFDGTPAELKRSINPPARPGAAHLWGWTFDTYFADMPEYLPFLWQTFTAAGGKTVSIRLNLEDVVSCIGDDKFVFNCLGYGAIEFLGDKSPCVIVRGKQVLVPGGKLVTNADRTPISYNYTPTADVFTRADGKPEYVHFFPRSDGWVLGQTREPGRIDDNGNWVGDSVTSPERRIGECSVFTPIIDLNASLLKEWCGYELPDSEFIGREGYRYYRDPDGSGVRLQHEKIDGTNFIHNYGHGGSGITMGWGCALQSARLFMNESKWQPKKQPTNELGLKLLRLIQQTSN